MEVSAFENKIFNIFLYLFLCKTILLNDASPQVSAFLANWFWEDFSLYIPMQKLPPPNYGPTLSPGIMIETNLNLHYRRKVPHKSTFLAKIFSIYSYLKRRFFSIYSLCPHLPLPLWPHPIPSASTQITDFLAKLFLRRTL